MTPSTGPFPRATMWALVAVTVVIGLPMLIFGIHEMGEGVPRGIRLVVLSSSWLVILAVAVPWGIRRGRL